MLDPTAQPGHALLATPRELAARQFGLLLRRLADELTYGTDASRFVGSGIDYAQSRMFAHGDPIKSIDWRVTARTGRLHVKDYEATKRTGLYILVDTSASMRVSSQPLTKHAAAVWIAGALSLVGLQRRSPVALVGCGARSAGAVEGLQPTHSRARLWGWIETLRHSGTLPAEGTQLVQRLGQVESLANHVSSIIVISDLHEPGAVGAIRRIAQRHDTTVLQMQDPAEAAPMHAGFLRVRPAESDDELLIGGGAAMVGSGSGYRPAADLAGTGVRFALVSTANQGRGVIAAVRRVLGQRPVGRGVR